MAGVLASMTNLWDYTEKKKELLKKIREQRINLKLLPRHARIDIEYKGYYYRCLNCGVILASLNDNCGCKDAHYDVFDLPEKLRRKKL